MDKKLLNALDAVVAALRADLLQLEQAHGEERKKLAVAANDSMARGLVELSQITPDANLLKQLQTRFRDQLADVIGQSPLIQRALTKPEGYAGDCVTLKSIYDNQTKATTPVGQAWDDLFLNYTLAETVRARKASVVQIIRKELEQREADAVSLLDLACGPCTEVVEYAAGVRQPLSISFVDHDEGALRTCAEQVAKANLNESRFINGNIFRLKGKPEISKRRYDVIYSIGLLDYIRDQSAITAIKYWWSLLAPGGIMVLSIKDRDEFNPVVSEWMTDWVFVDRNEGDFLDLLHRATGKTADEIDLHRDQTRISIQSVVRKSA